MFVLIEAFKLINIKLSTANKDINHTGQNNTHTLIHKPRNTFWLDIKRIILRNH